MYWHIPEGLGDIVACGWYQNMEKQKNFHHFKSKKLLLHLHYSSSQTDTNINLLVYTTIFILQDVAAFGGSLDILKEVHPEKLSRLHERLVTPVQCGGSCPLPSFPGQQEFYHDFILHCCHHSFLQHLADSLASEILALNATSFVASDLEDKGKVVLDDKVKLDILSASLEVVHCMEKNVISSISCLSCVRYVTFVQNIFWFGMYLMMNVCCDECT